MRVILAFLAWLCLFCMVVVAGAVWLIGQLIVGLWKPDQGLL